MRTNRLTLIPYYGGKSIHLSWLLPLLESVPHTCYVEPFGGGASVLLNKRRVPVEVYNDIDVFLSALVRIVQDDSRWTRFARQARMAPYARCLYNWTVRLPDAVLQEFLGRTMSFSGIASASWRFCVAREAQTAQCHQPAMTAAYYRQILKLQKTHERLRGVRVENRDFECVLRDYDSTETLFYLDPPYLQETRVWGYAYRHEMSIEDHERLVRCLVELRGSVVLSGYPNPLYDALLDYGYERRDYTTRVNAASTRSLRIESVWIRRAVV